MMRFITACFLSIIATGSYAGLIDWFENTNQRAARLMAEEKYDAAEKTFTNPAWQAVAAYRNKNYQKAATQFKQSQDARGFYNEGNALAYLGQFQAAIAAYDKALKMNPTHEDAKYNRELLKKLLDNNQQNQDNNKQDQDQDKQDQSKSDQEKNQEQNEEQEQKQNQQDQSQDKKDQNQSQQNQDKNEQEQALRLIPDDPGGLLREKFLRDHWRRLRAEHS